jgi:hypothetical protein
MITLYLNVMFTSQFWWKTSHFDRKWGLKANFVESLLITRGKVWTKWTKILVHMYSTKFAFQPHFLSKCDVYSSIWWSSIIKLYLYVDETTSHFDIKWDSSKSEWFYWLNAFTNLKTWTDFCHKKYKSPLCCHTFSYK